MQAVLISRFGLGLALLAAEILLVFVVFQILVSVECQQTGQETFCRGLRGAVLRGMAVLAALAAAWHLRPAAFAPLVAPVEGTGPWRWALLINLAGLGVVFLPLVLFGPAHVAETFGAVAWFLLIGGLMTAGGALVWAAPPAQWRAWLRGPALPLLPLLLAAAFIPDLAELLYPGWNVGALSMATFGAVHVLLVLLGQSVATDPAQQIIGTNGFGVQIAEQCAGLEGFALVIAFTTLYAVLMRGKVRQSRLWFVMLPLALLSSWLLNILRIAGLILIGAYVSPEHAINGFHSFAGWLFFTILVFVILFVMERLSWLHHGPRMATDTTLAEDWLAARILPFVAFMFSGVVTSAFWSDPALAYPLRAMVLLAALMYFRRAILAIDWRIDPVALGVGVGVGIVWVVAVIRAEAPDDEMALALAGLAPATFLAWAAIRTISTVLLVPVVEELFFRGYILRRLAGGAHLRTAFAVLVSSGLFALFHGNWMVAALAGLVFSGVMLRSGRLADAVVAHMAANLVVAFWALATNQWWVI